MFKHLPMNVTNNQSPQTTTLEVVISKKIVIISILSSLLLMGCQNGSNGSSATSLSTINLPISGTTISLPLGYFYNTTNNQAMPNYPTTVNLSYNLSNNALVINFTANNDLYVSDNQYQQDNSSMWNQEVFEMFIAAGTATPSQYIEIEVNPNNALFSAHINNPNGLGTQNSITYFDGKNQGIQVTTTKNALNNSWSGSLIFPLSLLGSIQSNYRLNFFRVVAKQAPDMSTTWACSATSCEYLAWSPTNSGSTPAFHRPANFGLLNLY